MVEVCTELQVVMHMEGSARMLSGEAQVEGSCELGPTHTLSAEVQVDMPSVEGLAEWDEKDPEEYAGRLQAQPRTGKHQASSTLSRL